MRSRHCHLCSTKGNKIEWDSLERSGPITIHLSFRIVSLCIVSYRFVSHRIALYRIVSLCIVSYRFVSCRIALYRVVSFCIVSYFSEPMTELHVPLMALIGNLLRSFVE
jgi:hypothetical protein